MHQLAKIGCLGILALTMAGCESGSQVSSTSQPSTPQVVQKQTAPSPAPKVFEKKPVVAQYATARFSSPPGLIQSTNPAQRAKKVQTGRQDPFAAILVPVEVKVQSPKPIAPKPIPVAAPVIPPSPPLAAVLPPQPDLAKSVGIMGVVQIGDKTEAIVQAPNELTSRYVQVGDRLSNGQVLVKRIEVNQGTAPVVILEQYGMEIARAVGEKTDQQAAKASPTAGGSTPPPPPGQPLPQKSEDNGDEESEK